MLALAYVALLATIAFGVPLGLTLGQRVNDEVRFQARSQADVVAATASDLIVPSRRADLNLMIKSAAAAARGRAIVVDRRGRLLADSSGPAELGSSYANRPEVRAALGGRTFQKTRGSLTLGEQVLATAVPVMKSGRPAGAVRITQSVAAVHRAIRRSVAGLLLVAVVVLLMSVIAGTLIARRLARPLRRLESTAREIAGGDLTRQAPVEGTAEQRSLASSFNEMTDRLSQASESQKRFVADASHQLRTPLTGLRLHIEEAQAISAPDALGDQVRLELGASLRDVDRLSGIIRELLVLSRTAEHDAPADRVDPAAAAGEAVERWRGAAAGMGIDLRLGTPCSAADVRCARADLDRALDSLLENALRYSPEGTAVTVQAIGTAIEVADEGPGLAAGEEAEVFERFYRGSAARPGVPGTGLGLPIALELARRWGGDATIGNRQEGGARATLWFPPAGEVASEARVGSDAVTPPAGGGRS